jgi:hypothetical protein
MKPTKLMNEAQLKALFEQAVRAIGFYEAQRRKHSWHLKASGAR